MTDTELRSRLLTHLYESRSKDFVMIGNNARNDPASREEIRIAEQLHDHGLIKFKILNRNIGGTARITAHGVDVMEGNIQSPVAIHVSKNQTINISGSSGFQVGDHNSQSIKVGIEALLQQIDASTASAEEKTEAKSFVRKLLEHPLVSAIVGGAIGLAK
jgi:hypothetical protein